MAQRQVNVRLDDEDFEVLEASAFVNASTLSEEVRQAVLALVFRAREEDDVQNALAIRFRREEEESTVTPIRSQRESRG